MQILCSYNILSTLSKRYSAVSGILKFEWWYKHHIKQKQNVCRANTYTARSGKVILDAKMAVIPMTRYWSACRAGSLQVNIRHRTTTFPLIWKYVEPEDHRNLRCKSTAVQFPQKGFMNCKILDQSIYFHTELFLGTLTCLQSYNATKRQHTTDILLRTVLKCHLNIPTLFYLQLYAT